MAGDATVDKQKQENNESGKPKSIFIKILVPVLIVAAIAAIFIIKNVGASSNDGTDYTADEFALDATDDFDLELFLSYGLPAVIDFGADECIPCKEMAPILNELNEELRGKAIVKFVDVWQNSEAANVVPLSSIPTQFFFNADGSPYVLEDPESAAQDGFYMYTLKSTGEHVFTAHIGGLSKESLMAVLREMGVE